MIDLVRGAQPTGRDGATTEPAIEVARSRVIVMGALFSLVFFVIAARLVDVTVLTDRDTARSASAHGAGWAAPKRAAITDRNGTLIATSLTTASLYADASLVPDYKRAARKLVAALPDLDLAEVTAKLASKRGFVWLKRHLTPKQQHEVNRLGIPGLDFQREERRVYPAGRIASHVVGFTDVDGRGIAGVERHFDNQLRADDTTLALSIDIRVQQVLHRELADAMRHFDAIGAAGIVLDATNGAVVAMVSLPDFDPNRPMAIGPDARFNRNTLGVYEMGSTFKIFTTAMALDSGVATLESGYDARKPIRVSRFVIRDYHAKKRWLTVPEIFMYSSNIGSVKMALDVGQARQRKFLKDLGMFAPPPIELPETGQPLLPPKWRQINTMTIAFGHGLSITPLHLASGVAAMVNGGVYYTPTLVKRDAPRVIGRRVISAATSDKIRRLLRLVVAKGTGRKAGAEGFLVGGKTGTAEKVGERRYRRRALLSSFVAAFPMNQPRYVVLAMLDEAKGRKETFGYATGGWVAAPIVKEVVNRIAPILRVRPVDETAPVIQRQMHVRINKETGGPRLASY